MTPAKMLKDMRLKYLLFGCCLLASPNRVAEGRAFGQTIVPRASYEPPEADDVKSHTTARCGYTSIELSMDTDQGVTRIDIRFNGKALAEADQNKLKEWSSRLRGQLEYRIMCDYDGFDIIFEEAFNRDANPRRHIEVIYLNGKLNISSEK